MPRRTTPTLTEAADDYASTRSHCSPVTLRNEGICIRKFTQAMGDSQVHVLTARKVEAWFLSEAKRVQPSSYNKTRAIIRGFLAFCTRRGWLDTDPMGEVRAHRVIKRERFRLSAAELAELPTYAATPRDAALLTLACNTALRAASIRLLRVRDVDLAGGWLHAQIPKTAQEEILPITLELDAALRTWLVEYAKDAGPLEPDWYLFPRRAQGQGRFLYKESGREFDFYVYGCLLPTEPISHVAEVVQKALRSAGHSITPGEGVHTLRRSVARCFFDANIAAGHDAALRMTSSLLSHASTATTEIYLGLTSERLQRDKLMRGKPFLSAMVSTENVTPISAVS